MNGVSLGALSSLVLFVTPLGCGGNSSHAGDDDAGSGGTATSGGSGGSGQGGTGGGPQRVSAAGLSINLAKPLAAEVPNLGSRSCPAGESGAATYVLGKPAPGGTIADGTADTRVSCVVTASGRVVVSLSGSDQYTQQKLAFDALATVVDKFNPSPLEITFFTPTTATLSVTDDFPGCTLGPVTTLKAGAILSDFECPLLGAVGDPSVGCKAAGTLAFEYCATE